MSSFSDILNSYAVGDVIQTRAMGAWYIVTDVHVPSHPLAESYGGAVLRTALANDGRRGPTLTLFPWSNLPHIVTKAGE